MYTQKTKSEAPGEQYSLDLEPTNEERISTSLDGSLSTRAGLTLKVAYEGREGKVTVGVLHDLVWVFARYDLDLRSRDNLLDTVEIAHTIFDVLKTKCVMYVYCMADSPSAFRFNELLGFKSVNAVIHDKHEVMEKEL